MMENKLFRELFHSVQIRRIFSDSKTFADAVPNRNLNDMLNEYQANRDNPSFDLDQFVQNNFTTREDLTSLIQYNFENIDEHIQEMWEILKRIPQENSNIGSKISLSKPYIVPGGRFDEIYYWDSYFTFLGLAKEGHFELMKNMLDNFSQLVEKYGHIPNGNRTYFLSRSQPPFFGSMIQLYANHYDGDTNEALLEYYPFLEKEYIFWMRGKGLNSIKEEALERVVKVGTDDYLNRYYDELNEPRPESYLEDYELLIANPEIPDLMRNIRAACESGWDFSTRWYKGEDLQDIRTLDIIPIDLNCLLYQMESLLQEMARLHEDTTKKLFFDNAADARKRAILKYCWDQENRLFDDYDWKDKIFRSNLTAAISYPLYFSIADPDQALYCKDYIENQLLKSGGIVTTPINSGQQWDSPNGWAPLQWITVIGLQNYGFTSLADEIVRRWVSINKRTFNSTGQMMEKYNVVNPDAKAGGGEYPVQEGFGWSNGVYLAFQDEWYKKFKP